MSISRQQVDLGEGLSFNPMFSIYSASMVGVFCALVLIMDAPLAVVCALVGLLFCYLLTCIFVFGSFRGFSGEIWPKKPLDLRSGFASSPVILFFVTTLAAVVGTYAALDPIATVPSQQVAESSSGGVTLRLKQSSGTTGTVAVQAKRSQSAQTVSKQASKTDSRERPVASEPVSDTPKPILAAARSDDLVGAREFRSHAWAVRETANLPAFLTLPEILFSILYGDDAPVAPVPDMVVAKQSAGGAARIMVSFLTTPQGSFKNHPVPKAGGHLVVPKRETVIAMQPPSAPLEPVTVVAKAPAPALLTDDERSSNTTVVVARLETEAVRRDPVAVSSTKQDLEEVTRTTTPLKPTAARTPEILLPPVLASIFYGGPNGIVRDKVVRKAPRLTTLTKTSARQTVKLVEPDPVTVVAKSRPAVQRRRHPIALAALADAHRLSESAPDGLGGPFSVVTDPTPQAARPADPASSDTDEPALVTGSISPQQINSAIRSLRFAPRFEEQKALARERKPNRQGAKSDLGPIAAKQGSGDEAVPSNLPQARPSDARGTVILKHEASKPRGPLKVALAEVTDDGSSDSQASAPRNRKQNAFRTGVTGADVGQGEMKPESNPELGSAREVPKKSPLSEAALRKANEEINSALRGAEADLKDTDDLLDEIDVIWSDHDKAAKRPTKRRPDTNASAAPALLVPVTARKGHVIIRPAAHTRSTVDDGARDVVRLPVLSKPSSEQGPKGNLAAIGGGVSSKKPAAAAQSAPKDRQLLGYIREQGELMDKQHVDCAVVGLDSKLRSCVKRGTRKL